MIRDLENPEQVSQDGNNNVTNLTAGHQTDGNRKDNPKRISANARERKRMSRINSGYDKLRSVLPGRRKLSKMEALQAAQGYILFLRDILQKNHL